MKKMNVYNKGITLIALLITIIVILIIGGITIYEGSRLVDEAKIEDVKTNMLLIQAEIKNFAEQAKFENKKIEDVLQNGIEIEDNRKLTMAVPSNEELKTVDQIDLYEITSMPDLNLGSIDASKYYISLLTDDKGKIDGNVEVYFVPGIIDEEGKKVHFLSDMQK